MRGARTANRLFSGPEIVIVLTFDCVNAVSNLLQLDSDLKRLLNSSDAAEAKVYANNATITGTLQKCAW